MIGILDKIRSKTIHFMPIFSLAFSLMVMSIYTPESLAQRVSGGDKKKTRVTATMSEKVYKKLTAAQEVIEAGQNNEGLAMLNDLLRQKRLTSYEKAQIYNFFAYTYFTLEKYEDAIRAYRNVLRQTELPLALVLNSTYTLAQLHFIEEDYKKAIQLMNEWFTLTEQPTLTAYMILGQAYYQIEDYKRSLVPLNKAYSLVKSRGNQPRENLLLLLRANYYNVGDFKSMIGVLKETVQLYPKSAYWITMGSAYSELKQLKKQMSIFEMLYEHGDLRRGNQQLNLANLYLMHEVPFKAAQVLNKGIKSGVIKNEVRNLRLLSQAWIQSQESEKSIAPLKKAAGLSKDGELDVRLASAYFNLDRYKEAVAALNRGIKKGKLKRADVAYIHLGMALFELKRFNSSMKAFTEAAKDKRSRKSASQWRKYVESERDREKQLEDSLKSRRS